MTRAYATSRARPVVGLLVPVYGPAELTSIPAGSAAGDWRWPVRWVDAVGGQQMVWCGERCRTQELPANGSAFALAARLGCPDLADRIRLNGDLLIAGLGSDGRLADAPDPVVSAAERAGLWAESA